MIWWCTALFLYERDARRQVLPQLVQTLFEAPIVNYHYFKVLIDKSINPMWAVIGYYLTWKPQPVRAEFPDTNFTTRASL
jgi:hypothetical protein